MVNCSFLLCQNVGSKNFPPVLSTTALTWPGHFLLRRYHYPLPPSSRHPMIRTLLITTVNSSKVASESVSLFLTQRGERVWQCGAVNYTSMHQRRVHIDLFIFYTRKSAQDSQTKSIDFDINNSFRTGSRGNNGLAIYTTEHSIKCQLQGAGNTAREPTA